MAIDRAQALLRELAEEDVPGEDAATVERRQRRVVTATALAIARAAKERERRERWTRLGVGIAAAAAVVAVAGGAWRARTALRPAAGASLAPVALAEPLVGALHCTHNGEVLPTAAAQRPLGAGDELTTDPEGRAQVVLASGVAITLESDTRLRLPDAPADSVAPGREEVRLASGTVDVHVPHLSPGHTFSIKTPDAEVTVHGTTFSVEVVPAASLAARDAKTAPEAATRVRVTTGIVSVASAGHETFLTAGMEWPSAPQPKTAEPAAAPRAASAAPPTSAAPSGAKASARAGRHEATGASSAKSRLGEENQLLSTAIAASRNGDYAGAVATLSDLLRRFPGSTLAQEAHVERFRALAGGGDRAGAAREARQYLALYPDGFAREEAKALAVGW